MTPSEADRYIEQILLDALTVHARYHAAITHLNDVTGGYSSTCPGAAPSTTPAPIEPADERGPDTPVEAGAFRPDTARTARNKINHELVEAANHLRITARAITANWIPGSSAGQAADAITRRIDDQWCTNHRRHHIYEPSARDAKLCAWCQETKAPIKDGGCGHLPDQELIEARARRGRLTTRDYDQFLTRMRSQNVQRAKSSRSKKKGAA